MLRKRKIKNNEKRKLKNKQTKQKINEMKTKRCGNCNSRKLTNLFSLGDLSFTGKFPKTKKININLDL